MYLYYWVFPLYAHSQPSQFSLLPWNSIFSIKCCIWASPVRRKDLYWECIKKCPNSIFDLMQCSSCISGYGSLIICNLKFFPGLAIFALGKDNYIIFQVSLVLFWLVMKVWGRFPLPFPETERFNCYLGNTQIQHFIRCFLCCCSFFHIFFSPYKDCVTKGLCEIWSNCSLGAFCYVKNFLINMLKRFHLETFWWESSFISSSSYQAKLDLKHSLLWKQLFDFPELAYWIHESWRNVFPQPPNVSVYQYDRSSPTRITWKWLTATTNTS